MKKLPDVIATAGKDKLWGLSVDKENGLMVGYGDSPEDVIKPTPLVLFLKWSFDWDFTPEWEKELDDHQDIYADPYWNKVDDRVKKQEPIVIEEDYMTWKRNCDWLVIVRLMR